MKNIAITGATSGIGLETARALLKHGHHLIFLVRNTNKAERLLADLARPQHVQIIECDLADLQSVKKAAEELLQTNTQLDVLINNAGGTFEKRQETKDGLEMHLAVNHIGHFFLVQELADLLKKDSTRIINVSSEAHKAAKIDFNNFNMEKEYSTIKAYANAKLYNILFTKSLARKGFTSYALHPGVIDSGFGENLTGALRLLWKLGTPFMKSPREGASTTVYLAINDLPTEVNGSYFKNKKAVNSSSQSKSEVLQKKLWERSEQLVKEILEQNKKS